VPAHGRLIIVNGGSSAGKTSLAEAFQDLAPDTWMLLGIDVFWLALPPEQLNLHHVAPEFYSWSCEVEDDGREYFVIEPGPGLDTAMRVRYRAIRTCLDEGVNVIADDVVWSRAWLEDAVALFEGYEVWFVALHVADAEGARREIARGDRHGGWNRGSARAAHTNAEGIYDLQLDSTERPPSVLARELLERLGSGPPPDAFARLRDRFATRAG
jgi:chloramphenicol 3-O phosphotransferase